LIQGLEKVGSGYEYVLFLPPTLQNSTILPPSPWFRQVLLPTPFRELHKRLIDQWVLPWAILNTGAQLFHSLEGILPFGIACPRVVTVHDLIPLLFPHGYRLQRRLVNRLNAIALRRADRIIAVSQCTRRDVQSFLHIPEEKIQVIPEAANPLFQPIRDEKALRRVQEKYAITQEFFLTVGGLVSPEPHKNMGGLLQAYRVLVTERQRECLLVLVGAIGKTSQRLQELATQWQIEDWLRFPGFVSKEELVLLYNASRALVFPSLYEGFGLPPLEAMACGTPVVAVRSAAVEEVVGPAGVFVAPGDSEALAEALDRVLSDAELRSSLRARGLERAKDFSWEKAATQTVVVYEAVLRSR